jgi:A/G-specific adenine glycosylase
MATAEMNAARLQAFRKSLLAWYDASRRDLPWRHTQNPYRIWVSEVMLQQTRVAAVLLHYEKFLQKFSTVDKLARARESAVLAQWSGLGYYRRARNLHAAARVIVDARGGLFPTSSEVWRTLPGIGRYTSAAIASIAFNEPVAVVDGNVERVLSRLLSGKQAQSDVWTTAARFLDITRPGDFNQAMMELGALVCLPADPLCTACPVRRFCRTRGRGKSNGRKGRQYKREITYTLTRHADSVLLVQRSKQDRLMPAMWELPQIDSADSGGRLFSVKHSITVTDFTVHVVTAKSNRGRWVRISRLQQLPITGLTRKILRKAKIIQ